MVPIRKTTLSRYDRVRSRIIFWLSNRSFGKDRLPVYFTKTGRFFFRFLKNSVPPIDTAFSVRPIQFYSRRRRNGKIARGVRYSEIRLSVMFSQRPRCSWLADVLRETPEPSTRRSYTYAGGRVNQTWRVVRLLLLLRAVGPETLAPARPTRDRVGKWWFFSDVVRR